MHFHPRFPFFKGQAGQCLCHFPAFQRPCWLILYFEMLKVRWELHSALCKIWGICVKFWDLWTHLWGISSQHLWEPCYALRCEVKVKDLKQPRLRMSSLSSIANLSQNNARHVGDLKQRRLQYVQYIYISHKQHYALTFWTSPNLTQNLYDGLGTFTQGWLAYVHIFNQNSIPAVKCEVRNLWCLVVLKFSNIIIKIVPEVGSFN